MSVVLTMEKAMTLVTWIQLHGHVFHVEMRTRKANKFANDHIIRLVPGAFMDCLLSLSLNASRRAERSHDTTRAEF